MGLRGRSCGSCIEDGASGASECLSEAGLFPITVTYWEAHPEPQGIFNYTSTYHLTLTQRAHARKTTDLIACNLHHMQERKIGVLKYLPRLYFHKIQVCKPIHHSYLFNFAKDRAWDHSGDILTGSILTLPSSGLLAVCIIIRGICWRDEWNVLNLFLRFQ